MSMMSPDLPPIESTRQDVENTFRMVEKSFLQSVGSFATREKQQTDHSEFLSKWQNRLRDYEAQLTSWDALLDKLSKEFAQREDSLAAIELKMNAQADQFDGWQRRHDTLNSRGASLDQLQKNLDEREQRLIQAQSRIGA